MANTNYSTKNAENVLKAVNNCIAELEEANKVWSMPNSGYGRMDRRGYSGKKVFKISAVCGELSIFDWWNNGLSLSQLKQMKKFLEQAISLGFTGYVCFKVGAKGCSHGMWAHKEESTDGYSPEGDVLFHSFRSGDNYFDMKLDDKWMRELTGNPEDKETERYEFSLKEVKEVLAKN